VLAFFHISRYTTTTTIDIYESTDTNCKTSKINYHFLTEAFPPKPNYPYYRTF